ncbi:ATP-binding protein [Thermococcus sp.]|uniref:ATP-binding protein n=1 Tax=Thermococcus sp. TaxID=35749 RepID=UPI002609BD11|nr:4Fe-4S dicluster domain-containing protein [Thermococcus sp.]
MMFPSFDWEKCIGCIACVRTCRGRALSYTDREGIRTITFEPGLCDGDLLCLEVCPVGAIKPSPKSSGDSATFPLARCENCGKLTDFTVKEVEWGKGRGLFDVFLCPECRRVESAKRIGEGFE